MNRNFKTIFALSMCAVLTIGLSTIASCSADEDYSAFAGDELETLAEGDMSMSGEVNYGDDNRDIYRDPNNCGGVALAILYQEKNGGTLEDAYDEIKSNTPKKSCKLLSRIEVSDIGNQLNLLGYRKIVPISSDPNDELYIDSVLSNPQYGDIRNKIICFPPLSGSNINHATVGVNLQFVEGGEVLAMAKNRAI